MRYVLGVDGGGTKTDLAVYSEDGKLSGWKRIGPSNHEKLQGGFTELEPILLDAIASILRQAGIEPNEVAAAVFGMSGMDVPIQHQCMNELLQKSNLPEFILSNDAFLGIKAALPSGIGCCLVNGTGNIAAAIDLDQRQMLVGGLGLMSGEVGGSEQIAMDTIRLAYSELFRCGKKTSVTHGILQLLGCDGPQDLPEGIHRFMTRTLPGYNSKDFVQLLFSAAQEGDGPAREHLRWLGKEFAKSLAGCIQTMRWTDTVDIVLVGSVTLKALCPLMEDTLRETLPALTGRKHVFHRLEVLPVAGAVLWAMEKAGWTPREALRQQVLDQVQDMAKHFD